MGNAGYGNHDAAPPGQQTPRKEPQGDPIRGAQPTPEPGDLPAAGPHADPSLINEDATPGTGALPPAGEHDGLDSTSS